MKKTILILGMILLLSLTTVLATECGSTPVGNCIITQDTTFTPGTYDMTGGDGRLWMNTSDVVLDCNGAILDGGGTSDAGILIQNGAGGYGGASLNIFNITVKNCNFQNYPDLVISASDDGEGYQDLYIYNNNITDSYLGIELDLVDGFQIYDNDCINVTETCIQIGTSINGYINHQDSSDGINLFNWNSQFYNITIDTELNNHTANLFSYVNFDVTAFYYDVVVDGYDVITILNVTDGQSFTKDTYFLHYKPWQYGSGYSFPNGLNIGANGITLDFRGGQDPWMMWGDTPVKIAGTGSNSGIRNNGYDNVLIKNAIITNYQKGIDIDNSDDVTVLENTVYNSEYGIEPDGTIRLSIINNTIIGSSNRGISLESGQTDMLIDGNNIHDSFLPIRVSGQWGDNLGVTIINNNVTNSTIQYIDIAQGTNNNIVVTDNYFTGSTGSANAVLFGDITNFTYTDNTMESPNLYVFGTNSNFEIYDSEFGDVSVEGNLELTGNTIDRLLFFEDHTATISGNTIDLVSIYKEHNNIDLCDGGTGNTYTGQWNFYPYYGHAQYAFDTDCINLEIPDGIVIRGNGEYGWSINGNGVEITGDGSIGVEFSTANDSFIGDIGIKGFDKSVVFQEGTNNNLVEVAEVDAGVENYGSTNSNNIDTIIINEPNTVFDCNGTTLIGMNSEPSANKLGLRIDEVNVTIQNCILHKFAYGMYQNNEGGFNGHDTIYQNLTIYDVGVMSILLLNSSGSEIRDVNVTGGESGAIGDESGYFTSNIEIYDSIIISPWWADTTLVFTDAENILIDNNYIEGGGNQFTDVNNLDILNNEINTESSFTNVNGLNILDNTINSGRALTIDISSDVNIANNDMHTTEFFAGLRISSSSDLIFENNNVTGDGGTDLGLYMRDDSGSAENILFRDNLFRNYTQPDYSYFFTTGGNAMDNITFTGNEFNDGGWQFGNDHNITIIDNIFERVVLAGDNIVLCDGGVGNTYQSNIVIETNYINDYTFDNSCNMTVPEGIKIKTDALSDTTIDINFNGITLTGSGDVGINVTGLNSTSKIVNSIIENVIMVGFTNSLIFDENTDNNIFQESTVEVVPKSLGVGNVVASVNVLGTDEVVVTPGYETNLTNSSVFVEGEYNISEPVAIVGNDVTVDGGGSLFVGENLQITGDNVEVINMVITQPMNVTGSNVEVNAVNVTYANYSAFQDQGETTELAIVENISSVDLTLDNGVAKLVFNEPVDLTEGGDLDAYVDVAHNEITVESGTSLDVPATLTFKDTGFRSINNILIMKDGSSCDDCSNLHITSVDDVNVDVTGFSTYVVIGADISQENYETMRGNFLYILAAFATVVIIIAATLIMIFVTGGKFDLVLVAGAVLALAVGFAVLLAVFVSIMNLFG